MREIKFRLIRDNEIVGYEYHLIDLGINKGICVYHQEVYAYKNNISESKYPITRGDEWFVFHDEKNQYTGLKDKNGKEIYEGDIIDIDGHHWIVKWKYQVAAFKVFYNNITNTSRAIEEGLSNYYEIIGNIYENKDLLIG